MAYELIDSPSWPHISSFNDLTTPSLRLILSHVLDHSIPLSSDEESLEIWCSQCLDERPLPLRSGEIEITLHANTGFDCRVSKERCPLDKNSMMSPWCCKTDIPHPQLSSHKSYMPALALTSNLMSTA